MHFTGVFYHETDDCVIDQITPSRVQTQLAKLLRLCRIILSACMCNIAVFFIEPSPSMCFNIHYQICGTVFKPPNRHCTFITIEHAQHTSRHQHKHTRVPRDLSDLLCLEGDGESGREGGGEREREKEGQTDSKTERAGGEGGDGRRARADTLEVQFAVVAAGAAVTVTSTEMVLEQIHFGLSPFVLAASLRIARI